MTNEIAAIPAKTIGIDLGDRRSSYCVLDAAGVTLDEGTVRTERRVFSRKFTDGAGSRAVIEASCQSAWIARTLEESGFEVIVANPRNVHLISKSDRKTDRNDARLLARLGRVDPGLLSPVTHRSERNAAARALLRARTGLIDVRTKLINTIRSEVKVLGGRLPACSTRIFHERVRAALPESLESALGPVLDALAGLQAHIESYDKEVERMCGEDYPETHTLRQVNGVGPLVALTYVVTLDDPRKFKKSRTVGAYLGLTPRSFQSGSRDPQLRISKRGDRSLRNLLVSAATCILRSNSPDTDLKRHGQMVARGGGHRDRAKARVAVARKLAILLHQLWLTGEVYEPRRSQPMSA